MSMEPLVTPESKEVLKRMMGAFSTNRNWDEGAATGQIWDSLSMKISTVMNYKPLGGEIGIYDSIVIINRQINRAGVGSYGIISRVNLQSAAGGKPIILQLL